MTAIKTITKYFIMPKNLITIKYLQKHPIFTILLKKDEKIQTSHLDRGQNLIGFGDQFSGPYVGISLGDLGKWQCRQSPSNPK